MSILIGADLVPTQSNIDLFEAGDLESLIGSDLVKCLNNADYRIFNIEAPITDTIEPIPKCGPNLRIPSACIKGLSVMKIDLVTLANNHILDQGETGLTDTYKYLDEAGISYTGIGVDINAARKPFVFSHNGKRIGVYACAEHEFSIATENSAGANPFDPLESPDDVYRLKQECDYVIVLYHGGKEFYRYPSPQLQKTCRKLIEKGADLVVCQHSHCIGCEEKYYNGTIVYGQGNFVFDRSSDEYWNTGLLIKIDDQYKVTYIPVVKHGATIKKASEEETKQLIEAFRDRSREILTDGFITDSYSAFARDNLIHYLRACYPEKKSLLNKAMRKLLGEKYYLNVMEKRFSTIRLLKLYNCIDCEAHKELFTKGLQEKLKDRKA
ncbi:MAG: CapA family protein [Clostridia bacterium]|nr:CapA family protein [Clostridia bacterium]